MQSINHLRKKFLTDLQPWDADSLLQLSCNKEKSFILAHPDYRLGIFQYLKFRFFLHQFRRGVPLAYLTGHKEFYGLDFFVNKHSLVPRPETELMVEEVFKTISNFQFPISKKFPISNEQKIILIDVGTGSGCIPISIIKTMSAQGGSASGGKQCNNETIETYATDISGPALKIARKNAKAHGVKVKFLQGDLLSPILKYFRLSTFDFRLIITANLPYGWKGWKNNGSIETKRLNFEPQIALFTGENGLELYRKLLKQIQSLLLLTPHSLLLFFEFDPRQTDLLTKLIKEYLPDASLEIKKDLAERDRLAVVKIKN